MSKLIAALVAGLMLCIANTAFAQQYYQFNFPTPERVEADIRAASVGEPEAVIAGRTAGRIDRLHYVMGFHLQPSAEASPKIWERYDLIRDGYQRRIKQLDKQWNPPDASCFPLFSCDAKTYKAEKHRYFYGNAETAPISELYFKNSAASANSHLFTAGDSGSGGSASTTGAKFLFGGIGLLALTAFMGIKLRGRQISRTNVHGVEVHGTAGKAVASEMGQRLFQGFARIAVTAAVLTILLGWGLMAMG